MKIYCCSCKKDIDAVKVSGAEIYPHRKDLSRLVRFRCPMCGNHVGTHKGSGKPLGCIPSTEIKNLRMKIHSILDPIWKEGFCKRKELYAYMTAFMGFSYHTAKLRTIKECDDALIFAKTLSQKLIPKEH